MTKSVLEVQSFRWRIVLLACLLPFNPISAKAAEVQEILAA